MSLQVVLVLPAERFLVCLLGGHAIVLISGGNTIPEFTVFRRTRLNGGDAIVSPVGAFRAVGLVEAQLGLALTFIRAVTGEATIGKEGPDIPVEGDFAGLGNR